MTTEERLRATSDAVGAAMRPVRPLNLHPEAVDFRAPAKQSRRSLADRWSGWLVPVAAAAAVVAVAATLVAVKGSSGVSATPHGTSAAASPSMSFSSTGPSGTATPGGVPPYYVTVNDNKSPNLQAVLGDTVTGKALVTVEPPANGTWQGVATSANDSTFVLYGFYWPKARQSSAAFFDVLRVPAGDPRQAMLTSLTLPDPYVGALLAPGTSEAGLLGAAVSPDGQTVAILSQPSQAPLAQSKVKMLPATVAETLRTYSLKTGNVLRTWTGSGRPLAMNQSNLSWLADGHTLAWDDTSTTASVTPGGLPAAHWDVQTLDTARPGTSLAADSRRVFRTLDDGACQSPLLTSDGESVICGTGANTSGTCGKGAPELVSYSVATGKLEHVLYRYEGTCQSGNTMPLWARSGSLAIGFANTMAGQNTGVANLVGVMTPTGVTPLPITQSGAINGSVASAAF